VEKEGDICLEGRKCWGQGMGVMHFLPLGGSFCIRTGTATQL